MLTIKVEAGLSESVAQCASEMVRLADLLTCRVEARFNGLPMAARPGCSAADVVVYYDKSRRLEERDAGD